MKIKLDELLTLSEACNFLKVHPNTLRNWDNQGLLPAKKIGTKGVRRYSKDDLINFTEKDSTEILKKPRVLDLFSGCGGLSYGLAKAGFDVVAGVDNWADSLVTFERNHPGAKSLLIDLGDFKPADIEKVVGSDIDVVIGGPPCQGFSISGKRDPNDPRNKLYQGFVDVVRHFSPKAFILENVPNLISMSDGAIKDEILKDFTDLGYSVQYKVLLASDYGVPQNRRRVIFVGVKDGDNFTYPVATHAEIKRTCFDALSDLPEESMLDGSANTVSPVGEYQRLMRSSTNRVFNHLTSQHSEQTVSTIALVPDGGNYKDLPEHLKSIRKVNIAWTRYSSKKPSLTIDTGHRHHFHYKFNRIPTVRESARLQSFPDDFIFYGSKTSQYKQVGNAVPPLLAEAVGNELLKVISKKVSV
jgi:DNA (cytosine-5)-methyltransferase 1